MQNLNNENGNNDGSPENNSVSQRKREANRKNAQKSTGPLSELGKSYSRRNALTHCVYAQKVRLDLCHEDPHEFADICTMIKFELSASGIAENLEAERVAMFHWKLVRLWRYENAMISLDMQNSQTKIGHDSGEGNPEIDKHVVAHPMLLDTIHRAQKTAERGLDAAYKRFRSLRKWRQKVKLNDSALFDQDGDIVI